MLSKTNYLGKESRSKRSGRQMVKWQQWMAFRI